MKRILGGALGVFTAIGGFMDIGGALQARLGYAYGDVDGPWVLRWALGRLGRRARYVPWGSVTTFEHGVVTIRGRAGDLRHPSDADRAGT